MTLALCMLIACAQTYASFYHRHLNRYHDHYALDDDHLIHNDDYPHHRYHNYESSLSTLPTYQQYSSHSYSSPYNMYSQAHNAYPQVYTQSQYHHQPLTTNPYNQIGGYGQQYPNGYNQNAYISPQNSYATLNYNSNYPATYNNYQNAYSNNYQNSYQSPYHGYQSSYMQNTPSSNYYTPPTPNNNLQSYSAYNQPDYSSNSYYQQPQYNQNYNSQLQYGQSIANQAGTQGLQPVYLHTDGKSRALLLSPSASSTDPQAYSQYWNVGRLFCLPQSPSALTPHPLYAYRRHFPETNRYNHFYTTNPAEIGTTTAGSVGNFGYLSMGILGYVGDRAASEDMIPVYRWYSGQLNQHLFDTDSGMGARLNQGFGPEGTMGYVFRC